MHCPPGQLWLPLPVGPCWGWHWGCRTTAHWAHAAQTKSQRQHLASPQLSPAEAPSQCPGSGSGWAGTWLHWGHPATGRSYPFIVPGSAPCWQRLQPFPGLWHGFVPHPVPSSHGLPHCTRPAWTGPATVFDCARPGASVPGPSWPMR